MDFLSLGKIYGPKAVIGGAIGDLDELLWVSLGQERRGPLTPGAWARIVTRTLVTESDCTHLISTCFLLPFCAPLLATLPQDHWDSAVGMSGARQQCGNMPRKFGTRLNKTYMRLTCTGMLNATSSSSSSSSSSPPPSSSSSSSSSSCYCGYGLKFTLV